MYDLEDLINQILLKNSEKVSIYLKIYHICPNQLYNGKPPIHFAIENDLHQIVEILLENGADVFMKDNLGRDAIWYVKRQGNQLILKIISSHTNLKL